MFNKKYCIIFVAVAMMLLMIMAAGCAKVEEDNESTNEFVTLSTTNAVETMRIEEDVEEYFLQGIDVSQHQASINVNNINASVVVVRLGYSGYGTGNTKVDSQFFNNMNKLSTFEGEIALYWASHSISVDEVKRENEFIIETLSQLSSEMIEKIDYLFIDREQSGTSEGRADNLGKTQFNTVLSAQVKDLQKMLPNMKIGVYTNVDYLVNMIDYEELGNVPCWIAWYVDEVPTSFENVIERIAKNSTAVADYLEKNIVMWQYSQTGSHPGINGPVDLNVASSRMLG